jgi:glutathione S-transferase
MLKLIIGNKAYSSWSLRGWLAVKQSGLAFEEIVVPLYDDEWDRRREGEEFDPSGGKVPILWDGEVVVWDSLAIMEYLEEQTEQRLFWPADPVARAMARSMAAEMHSSYDELKRHCPMNIRQLFPPQALPAEVQADVGRILNVWKQARSRYGADGDFLFGAEFGAADIMFAPVCTRFATYAIPLPDFAIAYCEAILHHPFMEEWMIAANEEPWVLDRYEQPQASSLSNA